ncbi:hypothetical protein FWF74_01950 [Candidatus Saccharibacteria bacterium]|nr:hypothetical protein [Candidatus Saccharibacteria bacterium]MCL1963141.1 hypothetical protein [Candidatus Saccharibacteria bacterium]
MFRKLVSSLAFSPSLVEQLGIYARRLDRERRIRRAGLILIILAVVAQVFIIMSPPESTNTVAHNSQPTRGDSTLTSNISAVNHTQNNVDATTVTARESDIITYNLAVTNNYDNESTGAVSSQLSDILEYAEIVSYGGGEFGKKDKTLTWKDISLEPGASTTRNFTISIKNPIPSVAQNGLSYDCIITNEMNNLIDIKINCPPQKVVVEQTILNNLPHVNIVVNTTSCVAVVAIASFLRFRSRQLAKEIRLIRKKFNSGTLQ